MADIRPQYTEEAVGANHPTKADVINRAYNLEHDVDGTHKTGIALGTPASGVLTNCTGFPPIVSGYSATIESATFNTTATKVCKVSITIAKTSAVLVMAAMDAYYGTNAYTFRTAIHRDGALKATGPYSGLPLANNRASGSVSWVELGLAAGTYEFQLYATNTTDNNNITTGNVQITVLAIGTY